MPYKISKRKCKKSNNSSGEYELSYTDKNGKKHSYCHSNKENAKKQIAAIEANKNKTIKEFITLLLSQD